MTRNETILTKRAYDPPQASDGTRILVDRLWPRGLSKGQLAIDAWIKDIGPSNQLRKWFGHQPERWEDFIRKYFHELDEKPVLWQEILAKAKKHRVTLVHAAKDRERNNAVALKLYLEARHAPLSE